jgi:hypothetical protein
VVRGQPGQKVPKTPSYNKLEVVAGDCDPSDTQGHGQKDQGLRQKCETLPEK